MDEKPRVLVYDMDGSRGQMHKSSLNLFGFKVFMTTDIATAVAKAKYEDFDFAVVDWHIGMNKRRDLVSASSLERAFLENATEQEFFEWLKKRPNNFVNPTSSELLHILMKKKKVKKVLLFTGTSSPEMNEFKRKFYPRDERLQVKTGYIRGEMLSFFGVQNHTVKKTPDKERPVLKYRGPRK